MVPFAAAAGEYGALASRGSFERFADALSSPDLGTVALGAAAVGIVVLATRRSWRLAFLLLMVSAAVLAANLLDLW